MYTPTINQDEINSLIGERTAIMMRIAKMNMLRELAAIELDTTVAEEAVTDAICEVGNIRRSQYLLVQTKLDEKLGEVYALARKAIEAGIQLEEDTPGGF